jgi:hypothetical protein
MKKKLLFFALMLVTSYCFSEKYDLADGVKVIIERGRDGAIEDVSYSYLFKRDIRFSEIEKIVTENSNFGFPQESYGLFHGNFIVDGSVVQSNVVVDGSDAFLRTFKSIIFHGISVELNGRVFPNVKDIYYNIFNYDPEFYKSFPNVEKLEVVLASGEIQDLSFLRDLKNLKSFQLNIERMNTKQKDKELISALLKQYYEYITTTKNNLEGFVDIITPYHYPNYAPEGDFIFYYVEPPEWYDGPDMSGVPAWLNDDRVNFRAGPSLNARVIKQLNTGDFVMIKGRAEIYEDEIRRNYSTYEITYEQPWKTEEAYRNEQSIFEQWIKVRLADRTDGYIYGPYLTLKNPKYFPFIRVVVEDTER